MSKPLSIEARQIAMPRIKRFKKQFDLVQLAEYFSAGFTGTMNDNDERMHYMMLYALCAAFDAEISREAFCDLAVDILNMRARSAACNALQLVAINHQNAHLTPELIAGSHLANLNGLNADANAASKMLALIAECRGQDDAVN